MGVGISCDGLTNYATNKFECRRRQKNSIENMNKSKSDTESFTVVSTKNDQLTEVDQFDPRKRRRDKQIDEHQASQVIYLILPNNECLFFEKLNCDLCLQQFTESDDRQQINELETIIDQSMTNEDKRKNNEMIDNDENSVDNVSLNTIKSTKLNSSLIELDNQDLNFIDQIDESITNYDLLNKTRELSSIEEEHHHLSDSEQMLKDEVDVFENNLHDQSNDRSPVPRRSSVKVQMSSLTVTSLANEFSDRDKQLKETNLKSKVKQNSNFATIGRVDSLISNTVDDEENSDEEFKEISKDEKRVMLKEMLEITKRGQIENHLFSNSINLDSDNMNDESIRTELIRSFSADYARDLLTNQLLNEFADLDYIDYRLSKLTSLKNSRLMYLSETDLSKLKDNEFDNKSIATIKTELLNLDSIESELLDRDQLESVTLDDIEQNETRTNRMNNFESNISFKLQTKLVTKTKRIEDLNKRSLVNSWLKREQFDQDCNQFNSLLNQQFNSQFNQQFGEQLVGQSFFSAQSFNNQKFHLKFKSNLDDCTVDDCNLCRFNEKQSKELDSDVLQLMHVLQSLDEILHDKEHKLKKLVEKADLSSNSNLCNSNKQKLIRSRASLRKKVNLLRTRGSRLGISMTKNDQGKQLIIFNDGKSTYHIEINDCEWISRYQTVTN